MATAVDARRIVPGVRPEVRTALLLSAVLLLYGNGVSLFSDDAREGFLLWSNLTLMLALLVWAFAIARMTPLEAGLDPANARGSALFGAVLSVIVALPPLLFVLLAPLFSGGAVEADEITDRSGASMAFYLLFRLPIGTALFEEITFRGVLYGAWLRAGDNRLAWLASSAIFALWHVVITSKTVAASGVVDAPWAVVAGVVVSLLGLFVGGLIFAYLRWHTSSIAAAAIAHWLIVGAMATAVWAVG
jgi:membrane protease YdiL (CAAX protease family)